MEQEVSSNLNADLKKEKEEGVAVMTTIFPTYRK